MTNEEVRRYLSAIGKRGGAAGTGKAKRRGSSAYYQELAKLAAAARKAKAKKKGGR